MCMGYICTESVHSSATAVSCAQIAFSLCLCILSVLACEMVNLHSVCSQKNDVIDSSFLCGHVALHTKDKHIYI